MQPEGRLTAATCRLLLLLIGLVQGWPQGNGAYAFESLARRTHFLSLPFQGRTGEWRPIQSLRDQGAPLSPTRTLHAFAPAALNGEGSAGDEYFVDAGESTVKEQQGRKDHRQLGTMMELFCFPKPKVGAMGGLGPALLPRGLNCIMQLQQAVRSLQEEQGFEEVRTGSLAQAHLWHRSGHMEHFAENMYEIANPRERGSDAFPENEQNVEMLQAHNAGASYLLKPMSCPLHLSYFFDRSARSGSALPLRISEFGHVFRREVPSALCGLMRLREFTQDDGHILCRMSQASTEVTAFLLACQKLYKVVGLRKREIVYRISTRPKNSQGSGHEWDRAEGLLRSALEQLEIPFTVAPGEGAFYGPKVDIHIPDVDGRLWQTGTLQVDLFSPKNFGLDPMPNSNDCLCLLHRAMCGSLERFFGLVLEHLDGHLPFWLAPTQVALLSVGEGQAAAAEALSRRLRRAQVRVSLDTRPVHISKKLKWMPEPKTNSHSTFGPPSLSQLPPGSECSCPVTLNIRHRTPEVWLLGPTDHGRNTVTVRRSHGEQSVVPIERALAAGRRRAKLPL